MPETRHQKTDRIVAETRQAIVVMDADTRLNDGLVLSSDDALRESREALFEAERLLRR